MSASSVLRIAIVTIVISLFAPLVDSFAVGSSSIKKRSTSDSSSTALFAISNPFKSRERGGKKSRSKSNHILHVESIEEYKEKVVDEKEQITVVRFYSQYCSSCRSSQPMFYKLAADFQQHGVKFVEVPLTKDTKILHDALEVPSLPWTHIYHPDAGLVEERKVSRKFIDEVRKCLRCYVYGECDLADAPADCFNIYGECAIDGDEN